MSQSPLIPRPAIASSSSSGIASSVRISRPYARDSWSSQTYVLFAARTRRGIHSRSVLNRSGSASAPTNDGRLDDGRPATAAAAAAEAQVQTAFLLGEQVFAGDEPRREGRPAGWCPTAPGRSAAGRPATSASGGRARAGGPAASRRRRRHRRGGAPSIPRVTAAYDFAAATGPGSTSGWSGWLAGFSAATSRRSSDSRRSGRSGSAPNSLATRFRTSSTLRRPSCSSSPASASPKTFGRTSCS